MKTLKSIGAVLAGIVLVFALSTLTDVILEKSNFMKIPFTDNPTWLVGLVLLYRCVYVVAGAYLTAALAPHGPMRHVWVFAGIGFVLGVAGTVFMWNESVHWYPVALVITGIPCSWLGGWLRVRKAP